MGININTAHFLTMCYSPSDNSPIRKVDYSKSLMLGRQAFSSPTHKYIQQFKKRYSFLPCDKLDKFCKEIRQDKYAETLFKLLGAHTIESLDCSDYESSSIIHDLNDAVPPELENKFTCVFDGGTLEHVFNYPVALNNAMKMVCIGGHLILSTPGNNWFGHGFYQFSPDLFYSVLCEENGFADTLIFCNNKEKWYFIEDYCETNLNIEVYPKWENMLIYIVSRKCAKTPERIAAYQSIYEKALLEGNMHKVEVTGNSGKPAKGQPLIYRTLLKRLPLPIRRVLRHLLKVRIIKNIVRKIQKREDFKQIYVPTIL